jgi:hypothetical protein
MSHQQMWIILVGTLLILTWVFWHDLKLWWYTPWCVPCQQYTIFVKEQVHDEYDWLPIEDRYVDPEHYRCRNCGRRCEVEDAFRLWNNLL